MVLKISAPCVSDGSGNPVIANKTKCSVAICFYFTDCFFRAPHFIAMTDCNGQRGFFVLDKLWQKKHAQNIILLLNQLHISLLNLQS